MRATYKKIGKAPTIWGWRSPPWQGRVAPSFPLNSLYGNREAKFPKKSNSVVDEIDPRQPLLRINILRWREIFRMIETSSCNVDLIGAFVGLIG